MRPIITVVLIALLNALPVTQVVAQAPQQQPPTTQVRQSGPWLPPRLQAKAWKPVPSHRPSGGFCNRSPIMPEPLCHMRTVGLAPDANTRSRHRTVRKISSIAGTIVCVISNLRTTMSDLNLGASAGTFLSTFGCSPRR